MTAICGFLGFDGASSAIDQCGRMLEVQLAYGPHDGRTAGSDDVAFGRNLHRCLPEDDHDTGPLSGGGGRYLLVADVRLDNRDELLERLGRLSERTSNLSDAAVLLGAWERWGDRTLDLLLGDYAFAVWDRDAHKLLLARDPLGQRSLCYHLGSDGFAFSSMPKGLHALPSVPRRPDLVRMTEFIGGLPHLGPRTYYAGVQRVEPAHIVTVSGRDIDSRRYWNPERRELRLKSFNDYRDAFRAEIDRAVRCRLRGTDGVVATHLSSGWDSSSVSATAARLLAPSGGRVLAFTSVPRPGNASGAPLRRIADEGPIASQTAAFHENMDHVSVEGTAASPVAGLDELLDLFDRPLTNLCNEVWMGRIRREAADREARVLLTGEVGNWTISAAPPTLLADLVREGRWASWWREARAKIRRGDARYRGVLANSFGPWLPAPLWNLVAPLSLIGKAAGHSALHPGRRMEVARRRSETGAMLSRPPRNSFSEVVKGLAEYDFGHFRKGALAGWGIDERDPTGDRRLIEFCLSLPIDMLLKDGIRRPLAKAALSDRLPAAVLEERSKGYQASDWHEGLTRDRLGVAALIEEIASDAEAASVIDVDALRAWEAAWPNSGWEQLSVMARYRTALLQALSAGHFMGTMQA